MKKSNVYLAITWIVLLFILPIPLVILLNNGLVDSREHIIAIDLGIYAYVWWLANVFLATRPRWLVNKIGMPPMYMIHGMLGAFAIFAAGIHKFTLNSYHAIIRNTGNLAWYLAIILVIFAVVFLSGYLADHFKIFAQIKSKLPHQVSLWIHRLNFVVIGLIWLHVHVIPRISNVPYFSLVFDLYTLLFLGLYVYQKFIEDADMRQSATVVDNKELAPNVQQITLKLNDTADSFKAGNFYFLSFRNKSKKVSSEKHPFSIAGVDQRTIKFIIHKRGDFSKQIGQVSIGTSVKLEGPFGLFDQEINEYSDSPIVLYALGTGIGPMLSLAEKYASTRRVHLVWSRGQSENYVKDRLDELIKQGVQVDQQQHRFNDQQLRKIFSRDEINTGIFFIVGSSSVLLKVRKNLKRLGVTSSRLFDEHLSM